jgi:DNA-binding transcriptional MerR regulator
MEPFDPNRLTKLYYSIGEVADMFNVNTSLIRFWEKEFKLIQPKKNTKGNRLFTSKDIQVFYKIYTLVKSEGYTLDGAKKTLKSKNDILHFNEAQDLNGIIDTLEKIKEKLKELKRS